MNRKHCYFKVDFEIDFVPHSLACVIGVKQGDTLGPTLFIIFSATIMITWRKAHNRPLCIFRTKEDFKITDKRYNTKGTEYADDIAVLFDSRLSLEVFAPLLIGHFQKFGIEIMYVIKISQIDHIAKQKYFLSPILRELI